MRSWLRNVFTRPVTRPIRKAPPRFRLALEALEDRCVPAMIAVNNLTDTVIGGQTNLRQAIAQATGNSEDDTIQFATISTPQTISLSAGQLDLTSAGSITIQGPGANLLSVSGGGASRVFALFAGSATLSGLTITGGSVNGSGGGVFNNGGTITLSNCIVSNNHASVGGANLNEGGGGLYNTGGGTMTLTGCTISDNDSLNVSFGSSGGGLFNNGGTVTLTDCSINGNDALFGGGVFNKLATATLSMTNCTISGNTGGDGGGLYNFFGAATLTGCTVSGNTDGGFNGGGGLLNRYGAATLTNCTVSGNSTPNGVGGGLFNSGTTSTLTLTNCTVSGNSAASDVGGGLCNVGIATLTNCTVSGNSASTAGGVFNSVGTVTLRNTIIAGNTAVTNPDVEGVFASQGNNLIGIKDGGSGWVKSDRRGTAALPLDPLLGPLADNGGPTLTMALLAGSPAIGKGKNSLVPAGATTDQRGAGFARLVGTVDIGAYEFPAAVVSGKLIVVGTPDDDIITIAKGASTSQAIVTHNGTGLGTFGGVLKTDIRGGAGDDEVSLTSNFARPATLVGGAGNDTLTGGKGKNVLLGGADLDVLTGGVGRDLIVGGTGADNLLGGGGEDILLGGTLTYYDEFTDSVNAAKIGLVMKEWGSTATYPQRIAHLKNGGGLNGSARIKSTTVLQDGGAVDNLSGDLGRDWFVVSAEDLLTDQTANESKTVV